LSPLLLSRCSRRCAVFAAALLSPLRSFRRCALLAVALLCSSTLKAQAPLHLTESRFTAQYYPNESRLAHSLLQLATTSDSFPGLPRPKQRVTLLIAPDQRTFREWIGPGAPEWGAAIAFPNEGRIVMQGRSAGSDAGDPREVLRHELAHLALHEALGDAAPRWFDEGYASYAARELTRDDVLAANVALVFRGMPTLDELDDFFVGSGQRVQAAYALSYRAVAELAQLDTVNGLTLFIENWKKTGGMDRAMRATYGMTFAEFEQRWRERTRRRFGMLALVGDFTVGGAVLVLLLGPLYLARRRRDRRRMAALVAADALSDAAGAAPDAGTLEELLKASGNSTEEGASASPAGEATNDENRTRT